MNIKKVLFIVSLLFWPISLYLTNTRKDFITYAIPAALIAFSFYLNFKQHKYSLLPMLLIPLTSPKLAVFPLILFIIQIILSRKKEEKILTGICLLLSILTLAFLWRPFIGQTIVVTDYEAQQKVIRDQRLYPSILMARAFSNKARIITGKFSGNFFALTDPNNYFFSFHPREQSGDQDLPKFPFVAFPFVIFGIYKLIKDEHKSFFSSVLVALLISLSLLTDFDRNDFILWIPVSYLLALGLNYLIKEGRKSFLLIFFYILFLIPDLISMLLRFTR